MSTVSSIWYIIDSTSDGYKAKLLLKGFWKRNSVFCSSELHSREFFLNSLTSVEE